MSHPRRISLLGLVVLSSALAGCARVEGTRPGSVQIRVANDSRSDFQRVRVGFPSEQLDYGPIAAGARSGYRLVSQAYRYAYVEAQTADTTLVLQPIDYVGETPLEPGRYTYRITLEEPGPSLRIELAEP